MLERLKNFTEKEKIKVCFIDDFESKHNLLGLFVMYDKKPCILLDSNLLDNHRKLVEVAAEECGHYATSFGDSITKDGESYFVIKNEKDAEKWKCEFLLPDELLKTMLLKHHTILDIANELDVNNELVLNRLRYLSLKQNIYDIGDRIVDLTKLPNLVKHYKEELCI